ncbi:glycosyltransferase family 9 protein [Allorhizocola rhizosphaerae]|uniref:glycosyltransferase family 9 protein n=1 Tax=Allorhizocola rhizosphaerae TaxID=1872709 RepID=UPI000E3DD50C|nr:glycosyltransferase family 9 protein [Allorhizocola rhizosphaerae]
MTVLVLRALGIGDLATAVPALRGIRAAWPGQRLALAAPAWLAQLVPLIGAVDELAVTPGLTRSPLVTVPDVAVNLHGRGPQSHRLLARLRPKRTLGFNLPCGPKWRDDEHEVRRWCRMLEWYGIEADPSDLALHKPKSPPPVSGATVLHVGAKSPERRWSRFAALAEALPPEHRVVLTGNRAERAIADGADGLNLAGKLDLEQLAALICAARLVVSGDTGVAHLATAFGVPSVVLFGPMSPALWGPPPLPRHQVLWDPETLSVDSITVADVLAACDRALTTASAPT